MNFIIWRFIVEPPFFKQCCSNINVGCYSKAKIRNHLFVLFQQSTMYKTPPVFSHHSFKTNSDQLYLDIEEYLQENIQTIKKSISFCKLNFFSNIYVKKNGKHLKSCIYNSKKYLRSIILVSLYSLCLISMLLLLLCLECF